VIDSPGECAEVLLDLAARSTDRLLTYRVPDHLRAQVQTGVRVLVPLGTRTAHGFVIDVHPCLAGGSREIREILAVPDAEPLFSPAMLELARWVAAETLSTLLEAVRCLVPPEIVRRRAPAPLRARGGPPLVPGDQDRASAPVAPPALRIDRSPRGGPRAAGSDGAGRPTLLWGDAEARYGRIIAATAAAVDVGGQALVLVPAIALIPDLLTRARGALGDRVEALHSALTERERRNVWRRIASREVGVVIGTRSAVFAPLDRLRLVIVDEEQDPTYKAEAAPRYHARDVALHRGEREGAQVLLGSPTPSVETYAAVAAGRMDCVRLQAAPAARVTLVDMRAERKRGRAGLLSQPLLDAMRRHLRSGGRVALFVNRLGYARILLCQECGHAVRCPRCLVTMPYDRASLTISCRMCGRTAPAPDVCPRCGGATLRWIGAGTERVEEVVRRLFPALRIARLDRETARAFARVVGDFSAGRVRLVIGTQLLLRARQLRPSLVGVVDADLPLHLPDFRAAERTLQQLRAVVAMAGGHPGPEAVVQTRVPEHPAIAALVTGDDERVYRGELEIRREFGYPPYVHLARLIASSGTRAAARALADRAAQAAQEHGVEVLGPAPVLDSAGRARFQSLLRAADAAAVREAVRAALATVPRAAVRRGARLIVELDPQEVA